MNKYLKFFSFLWLVIGASFSAHAQVVTNTQSLSINDSVKVNINNTIIVALPANLIVPEPNPSPEDQGFLKYSLPDGTSSYVKKENGITIEYKPKN